MSLSFRAAKSNAHVEFRQGRDAIDAAKAAGVDHLIFMSVARYSNGELIAPRTTPA